MKEGYIPGMINQFIVSEFGIVWVGSTKGLSCFDGQYWKSYTIQNSGLTKESIFALNIDQNNILWVGYGLYSGGGLSCFEGNTWKQFTKETSSLPSNSISSISVDKNNIKWIGTTGGLASYNDDTWRNYTFNDSTFMQCVYSSVVDNDNVKWFFWGRGIYDYQGVASFDGNNWIVYNEVNSGLRGNYISAMAVDKQNRIWFAYGLGKSGGVTCYDRGKWVSYTQDNSDLQFDTVLSIAVDNNKVIWFGKANGVSSFDGEAWKTYMDIKDKNGSDITSLYGIDKIAIGKDNSKWFDTNGGLWRFKEDTNTLVQEINSYPESFLLSVCPTPFNPSTTISFTLPSAAHTTLAVYDITGRKVRTLIASPLSAGNHSAPWDGKDDSGRSVSSGVYIARLESGKSAQSMKMLLIR